MDFSQLLFVGPLNVKVKLKLKLDKTYIYTFSFVKTYNKTAKAERWLKMATLHILACQKFYLWKARTVLVVCGSRSRDGVTS